MWGLSGLGGLLIVELGRRRVEWEGVKLSADEAADRLRLDALRQSSVPCRSRATRPTEAFVMRFRPVRVSDLLFTNFPSLFTLRTLRKGRLTFDLLLTASQAGLS